MWSILSHFDEPYIRTKPTQKKSSQKIKKQILVTLGKPLINFYLMQDGFGLSLTRTKKRTLCFSLNCCLCVYGSRLSSQLQIIEHGVFDSCKCLGFLSCFPAELVSLCALLICFLNRGGFLTASPFHRSFCLFLCESPFLCDLPHPDRGSYIPYISGRDKIKNLCHPHDRPEKLASHLNIAEN